MYQALYRKWRPKTFADVVGQEHITDPIAKGVSIGSAAHALGTAKAIELGEVEGAMSGLSIVVAGLLTVAGASVFANFM